MAALTNKSLLKLLDAKQTPDVRRCATVVLGELGIRDGETGEALHSQLGDADLSLRIATINALGKLKIEAALPDLVEKIKAGGPESELAAEAVSMLGVKGKKALQDLMGKVAPGLRRYIASAIAATGADKSDVDALGILKDKDPAVVEAALHSLMGSVPTLGNAQKAALAEQLIQFASNKKDPLSTSTEVSVVKLLAVLDDPRIGKILWERVQPGRKPEIRLAALQSIGKFTESPTKEQLRILFACAVEPDFRIAAPALTMLQNVKVTEKHLDDWLELFKSVDTAARQFALDKVKGFDTPALAEILLTQIRHADRKYAEAATKRLTELEHGKQALTKALLETDSNDHAWHLARTLVPFAKDYPATWRDTVFKKLIEHLEKADKHADPLIFVLAETDGADLRDRLETQAVELRKKKAYERALSFLKVLARDPACGFSARFELATVGLKLSVKELSEESRAKDHCLHQFSILMQHQQDDAGLYAQLEKLKWLEPEDLYYLGFHFADHEIRHRKLAGMILKLVVKRAGRTKIGQNAKAKLKTAGLEG